MTREEAIEVLQQDIPCEYDTDLIEALDMAIKALEQQSMPTMVYPQVEGITPVVVEPIPKLPPVNQQEPIGDLISRQDAIKAIEEKAKRIKNEDTLNGLAGAVGILFDLPSVNPQPCGDAISRQAVDEIKELMTDINGDTIYAVRMSDIRQLPPVKPQEKTGRCKDCKYFEYDSVAKVDGIPLIVAHEICNKWGDGCKTKEDGYCFLFEPQESEG